MTEGQRAYEAKRAARAGMTLDKWLAQKAREAKSEAERERPAPPPAPPAKPPGLFKRLLERANKPL